MSGHQEAAVVTERFGEDVFSLKVMRNYLSEKAFSSLKQTIVEGGRLDPAIADEAADAMKNWAVSKGATHYTHWFQPLTGATAEKHDAFLVPDKEGGALIKFSGKELIQGEPDASSFPSGGLRATFEARGYTGWDPTSPAFIKRGPQGATLCIPSVFCGWHGDALDKKTPLLRSIKAVRRQVERLAKLFGIRGRKASVTLTLGPEQEYFLIDREFYHQRLDLFQTGRTLLGREPAKHQQMADHYFGAIKPRVLAFMEDLDRALWRLGIPAKTRHNEVSPAQFEIAPMFEEMNLAVDHNMLMMEVMRETAEQHGLVCLLHEKPFANVNGSGKHNNWAFIGPDGKNWLSPGDNPRENAKFLTVICALIKAVDTHADTLRASVASPGNDLRLGGHEAPPAIISIYLGEELTGILEQIEKGEAAVSRARKQPEFIHVGVDALPPLPRDTSDRNRTSPFAFTGNKFEFRAVGAGMSLAGPNIVLNTIFADALDAICTQLENETASGRAFNDALESVLRGIIKQHKRVIFNGDNYSPQWHAEARKRGLPNLKDTLEATAVMAQEKTIALFERQGVLSRRELLSRVEVYTEAYNTTVTYEARCQLTMARTQVFPAAVDYLKRLVETAELLGATTRGPQQALIKRIRSELDKAMAAADVLETIAGRDARKTIKAMDELRAHVDELEGLVDGRMWPLPTYAEMLFIM